MDEVWGNTSGQFCYYYDKCQQCTIQIMAAIRYVVYSVSDYCISDMICAIKDLIRDQETGWKEKNKWNENYGYLIPYLELFI